jgi:hypothetical protein
MTPSNIPPRFDPFTETAPENTSAKRLPEMQRRAKKLLLTRSLDQLRHGLKTVEWLTGDYFSNQEEFWILTQAECGFPFLSNVPIKDRNEDMLRDALMNTSYDDLDFDNDVCDPQVKALIYALENFNLDDENFPHAKKYEYLAILALELIGYAIDIDNGIENDGSQPCEPIRLVWLNFTDLVIDIMEVVTLAESIKNNHDAFKNTTLAFNESFAAIVTGEAEALAKQKLSLAASRAANIRHEGTRPKKEAVQKEWDETKSEYDSKSDFARIIGERDGIKFRTLYDWLTKHEQSKL